MKRSSALIQSSLLHILSFLFLIVVPIAVATAQVPEWDYHEGEEFGTRFVSLYPASDGGVLVGAVGTFPIDDNDTISLFQLLRFGSDGALLWRKAPITDKTITPVDAVETEDGWIVIGMAPGGEKEGVTLWRGELDHGGELVENDYLLSPRFSSFVGAVRKEGTIMIAGSPLSGSRDVIVGYVPAKSDFVFPHDYRPGRGETQVGFLRPLAQGNWMAFGESYDSLLHDLRAFAWRLAPEGKSREFIRIPWMHRAEVNNVVGCVGGGYALGIGIMPNQVSSPAPHLLRSTPIGDKLTLHQLYVEADSRLLPVRCDQSETIALLLSPVETILLRIDLTGRITGREEVSLSGNYSEHCMVAPATDPQAFYAITSLDGRGWLGQYRVHVSSVESKGEDLPEDLDLSIAR